MPNDVTALIAVATGVVTLVAAVVGLLRYFNYRTKTERKALVGQAFASIVAGVSQGDDLARLANAILLRRFFDPHSEYAVAGLPYADDAKSVMTALLRTLPRGDLQKLLADGLAHAPSLANADLQRANLSGAYLGGADVSHADLFRADLSGASLKGARAIGATFYQARLVGTVCRHCDLRRANFFEADLTRAQFDGAILAGANFRGARNLPASISARLNEQGIYQAPEMEPLQIADAPAVTAESPRHVFLSAPNNIPAPQRALIEIVTAALEGEALVVERLPRSSYSPSAPLSAVCRALRQCKGAVIMSLSQLEVAEGRWRRGTDEERPVSNVRLPTPWNQIEAGAAAMLDLPLLIICDRTEGGVIDLSPDGADVARFDLSEPWDLEALRHTVRSWAATLAD